MKATRMSFRLGRVDLLDVGWRFERWLREGMKADGKETACLLTYVPMSEHVPRGRCIVVDLGGTRLRAAVGRLSSGRFVIEKGIAEAILPITRGKPLDRERFLEIQASVVAALGVPDGLPLGYCFSYPAKPLPDGDAELLRWTKEVLVPETEGQRMGRMLKEALAKRGVRCSGVRVVNDTVASLLAGVPRAKPGTGLIGLIVGTGTNTAVALPKSKIPKFPSSVPWDGYLPVNLESGNFWPPNLTIFDDEVDAASEVPGAQRFEKAVSGVYLGRVLAAAEPDAGFDPSSGSKGVVGAASGGNLAPQAIELLDRSASLVAATLAPLAMLLGDLGHAQVDVIAEGSLFWGAPRYAETTREVLRDLLAHLGVQRGQAPPKVRFRAVKNANLVGAAIAALA